MTRIKICGITRAEDALTAASSGAQMIGLVFYPPSPRYLAPQKTSRLAAEIPLSLARVGLFVNPDVQLVRNSIQLAALDLLQFHGEEDEPFCAQFGRPYWKAVRVRPGVDLLQCAASYKSAQGLLLDAYVEGTHGGTGTSFDWSLIPQKLPLPVILSGGLNADNVAQAIKQVRPYAVDVSSGVEASKGIKDAAKITAFINEVINVDISLSR